MATVEEVEEQAGAQPKFRRAQREDRTFTGITRLFAAVVALALAAIIVSLWVGSLPSLRRFGPAFLWTTTWDPVDNVYGAAVAIFGTLVTSAIAIVIAVPVSFGIAVFITELAPRWLKRPLSDAIDLLAAIPSIIYGMWGLFVFAPIFGQYIQPVISDVLGGLPLIGPLFTGPPVGIGIFTAGLILSIMVIPFICAVMREVFDTVPAELRESAYGLGATTWEVVTRVVLPYTKAGVSGGVMLGLGRALGETMAVTFVIGNAQQISASLFMPGNTISSTLANEFTEAIGKLYTSSLIELGLILFCISFVVLAGARVLLYRLKAREGAQT